MPVGEEGFFLVILNDDELWKRVAEKVERGSAVIVFNNVDDCANLVGFLGAISFAFGVEPPLDLSCVVLK